MIYFGIAAVVFMADFFIKRQIDRTRKLGEKEEICKGRIIIRKHYNKGAVFDSLEKWPWLIRLSGALILAVLGGALVLLSKKEGNRMVKLGMALVLGGGASNFLDRMTKGHVVDYFSFKSPIAKIQRIIFNISDLFIFLGCLLMALFQREK